MQIQGRVSKLRFDFISATDIMQCHLQEPPIHESILADFPIFHHHPQMSLIPNKMQDTNTISSTRNQQNLVKQQIC